MSLSFVRGSLNEVRLEGFLGVSSFNGYLHLRTSGFQVFGLRVAGVRGFGLSQSAAASRGKALFSGVGGLLLFG